MIVGANRLIEALLTATREERLAVEEYRACTDHLEAAAVRLEAARTAKASAQNTLLATIADADAQA